MFSRVGTKDEWFFKKKCFQKFHKKSQETPHKKLNLRLVIYLVNVNRCGLEDYRIKPLIFHSVKKK